MKKLSLLLLSLFLFGCDAVIHDSSEALKEHSFTKTFDYLYWHENNKYTIFKVNDDLSISKSSIGGYSYLKDKYGDDHQFDDIKIFIDLEDNKKPWYSCEIITYDHPPKWKCEVHISDINAMKTASWNHGRFGSGSTERLQ